MSSKNIVYIESEDHKKQKLTNWKKEPSFEDLYSDYQAAQSDNSAKIENVTRWREYMNGGKPIKAREGKSSVRPKLIRKQAEWRYPSLEDPFLSSRDLFTISPRTFEDVSAAEQNTQVINYQWSILIDRVKFVTDLIRAVYDEGTAIVKIGWEYEEKIVETMQEVPVFANAKQSVKLLKAMAASGKIDRSEAIEIAKRGEPIQVGTRLKKVKTKKIVKNQPKYEVRDLMDVTIDPTAKGDLSKAKFIIDEYETDFSELKKHEYKVYTYTDPKTGKEIKEEVGYYKNLSKIQYDIDNEDADQLESQKNNRNKVNFKFKDKTRKKLKAVDYWGYWDINGDGTTELIVATWIGKTLIRLEKNPFPFDELPYAKTDYMPRLRQPYGEPDAELLIENQDTIGKLTRAAHDIIGAQAVGQEFIDENFFASPLQKENYRKGRTAYFRSNMDPRIAIYRRQVDQIPASVFNLMQASQIDAESLSGIQSFSNGIGSQSLGSVAEGIRRSANSQARRELSILRRLSSDIFQNIGRKTVMMNQEFLEEEEVIRISNRKFVSVRREDLKGEFDLIVEVSTPEIDNAKAEKLNMLMQTNAAAMDPKLQTMIYSKIADLWKFPDLADEIRNHKPEPNPVQEQLTKIQIENAMLENQKLKMETAKLAKLIESEDSKIEERVSRISQNLTSETEENRATAALKRAQAKLVEAQAQRENINIKKDVSGETRNQQKDDFEAKYLADKKLKELELQHKTALEALKMELKAKEEEIKHFENIINMGMQYRKNNDNNLHKLTIAEIKARQLAQKAFENTKNTTRI